MHAPISTEAATLKRYFSLIRRNISAAYSTNLAIFVTTTPASHSFVNCSIHFSHYIDDGSVDPLDGCNDFVAYPSFFRLTANGLSLCFQFLN